MCAVEFVITHNYLDSNYEAICINLKYYDHDCPNPLEYEPGDLQISLHMIRKY